MRLEFFCQGKSLRFLSFVLFCQYFPRLSLVKLVSSLRVGGGGPHLSRISSCILESRVYNPAEWMVRATNSRDGRKEKVLLQRIEVKMAALPKKRKERKTQTREPVESASFFVLRKNDAKKKQETTVKA